MDPNQQTQVKSAHEYLFKVLVVGEMGTGKTSIIKRYAFDIFSAFYKSTIGVDFALKVLNYDPHTVVRLQLWDIAGQERFTGMTRVYYKDAIAAIIVYDITRPATFEAAQKWKQDIDSKVLLPDERPIPCILLANKSDLGPMNKTDEEMSEYIKEQGYIDWFMTSAKENKGIDIAVKTLVEKILENDALLHGGRDVETPKQPDTGIVKLDQNPTPQPQKASGGCCSSKM